jgi:hypothetical protein
MMWRNLLLLAVCLAGPALQAVSGQGNSLIFFEKFDYTNQTMTDLGFPEDNYSPSNFYTVSIVEKQRVVHSHNLEHH